MNRVLSQSVCIRGTDFWGRPSEIKFHPVPGYLLPGWYWAGNGSMTLIKPSHARSKWRRIALVDKEYGQVDVFEHIGFLRLMGFHSLVIECKGWPPFDGGAEHYLQALGPCSTESRNNDVSYRTVAETVWSSDPKKPNVGTRIEPTILPWTKLHISCDYRNLGAFEKEFNLSPESFDLLSICGTNTIGMPHWLHGVAKRVMPRKVGRINWLNVLGEKELKERILLHRAQDLLGALWLLCDGQNMFVGNVYSHCAGHRHDVPAVHRAVPLLTCL